MSKIPRHEPAKRKTKEATQPAPIDRAAEYAESDYRHSGCVEEALDGLTSVLSTWVTQERDGENGSPLYTGPHNYPVKVALDTDPVKITLAANDDEDTLDRLVTAFERIADAVAKLAGLSRPRLESWHEQVEYEPRYKDIAVDGGAPGPK